jgi:hypothetical protein
MADNFLEKHYNDYQSRKKEWEKNKQLNKIKKYYPPVNKKKTEHPSTTEVEIDD